MWVHPVFCSSTNTILSDTNMQALLAGMGKPGSACPEVVVQALVKTPFPGPTLRLGDVCAA
jgi:hypothetical protein